MVDVDPAQVAASLSRWCRCSAEDSIRAVGHWACKAFGGRCPFLVNAVGNTGRFSAGDRVRDWHVEQVLGGVGEGVIESGA